MRNARRPQLVLLLGVVTKALEKGRAEEAERILSSTVADLQTLADHMSTLAEYESLAEAYRLLAPILPQLEAATGRPWTRCLEVFRAGLCKPIVPPRGQA